MINKCITEVCCALTKCKQKINWGRGREDNKKLHMKMAIL